MGIIPPLPLHVYRPDAPRSFDEKGKGRLPDGTYPQRVAKYEAPQGAAMRLDCPPTCRSSLRDPSVPLWITEGQKKADALASHGFCALALLGVWNWRGRNGLGGLTALADWEAVALNGRQVRIVFDSDVMRKPEVTSSKTSGTPLLLVIWRMPSRNPSLGQKFRVGSMTTPAT